MDVVASEEVVVDNEEEKEGYCSSDYEYEYVDDDQDDYLYWYNGHNNNNADADDEDEDFTTRSDRLLAAILKEEEKVEAKPPPPPPPQPRSGHHYKTTGLDDEDDVDEQVDMSMTTDTETSTTATTLSPTATTTTTDALGTLSMIFCPKCHAEEHQPVQDCQRVANWTGKRNQLPTVDPVFIRACLQRFIRRASEELNIPNNNAIVEPLCHRYRWDLDAIAASRDPLLNRPHGDVHNNTNNNNGQNQGGEDNENNHSENDDMKQGAADHSNRDSQRSVNNNDDDNNNITCPICFDDYAESDMMALDFCQHAFCYTCWYTYLRTHLEEGQLAALICPAVGCTEAVLLRHVQQVSADHLLPLSQDIQLRSFMEANNETLRWCPGCIRQNHPNPYVAVHPRQLFLEHGGYEYGFVCTACQSRFCFQCNNEPHDGPCRACDRNHQDIREDRRLRLRRRWLDNEMEEFEQETQVARGGDDLVQTEGEAREEEMVWEAGRLGEFGEVVDGNNASVAGDNSGVAVAPIASNNTREGNGNGGAQEQAEILEKRQVARRATGDTAAGLVVAREARYAERERVAMPARVMAAMGADRQIKKCPRCSVDIEKIGGCNRMTCRCGHHFCWHCLEDYSAYGSHYCGRPDANRRGRRQQQLRTVSVNLDFLRQTLYEVAAETSFNATEEDVQRRVALQEQLEELERFAHFYNRYHAHEEGQRYSERQCPCLEGRADDYSQVAGIFSGTDVDFIRQANETLVASRRMLKYAYCAAYFHYVNQDFSASKDGSVKKNASNFCGETHAHLGFLQLERLERFTEELSEVSENACTRRDRSRVIDLVR